MKKEVDVEYVYQKLTSQVDVFFERLNTATEIPGVDFSKLDNVSSIIEHMWRVLTDFEKVSGLAQRLKACFDEPTLTHNRPEWIIAYGFHVVKVKLAISELETVIAIEKSDTPLSQGQIDELINQLEKDRAAQKILSDKFSTELQAMSEVLETLREKSEESSATFGFGPFSMQVAELQKHRKKLVKKLSASHQPQLKDISKDIGEYERRSSAIYSMANRVGEKTNPVIQIFNQLRLGAASCYNFILSILKKKRDPNRPIEVVYQLDHALEILGITVKYFFEEVPSEALPRHRNSVQYVGHDELSIYREYFEESKSNRSYGAMHVLNWRLKKYRDEQEGKLLEVIRK